MSNFLSLFLIIISFFQDLPLRNTIGTFGTSLHLVLLPLFFIHVTFYKLFIRKKSILREERLFLLFLFVAALEITLSSFHYFLNVGIENLREEDILVKNFKVYAYYLASVLYTLAVYYTLAKNDEKRIYRYFYVAYHLLFFMLLTELLNPNILNVFHSKTMIYPKIRLLTSEPSWTGMLIIVFYLFSLKYAEMFSESGIKSKFMFTELVVMFIIFLGTSDSKAFISLGSVLLIFTLYPIAKRLKSYQKVLFTFLLPFLFLLIYSFINRFYLSLRNDILYFTSTATRLYTMIVGLLYPFQYPLSSGAAYLYYLPKALAENLDKTLFSKFFLKLNLSEIWSYVYSSTESGMSVKSGLINTGVVLGVFSMMILITIYFELYKKFKDDYYLKLLIVFLFLYSLINEMIVQSHFWLAFGTLMSIEERKHSFLSQETLNKGFLNRS